jgi:hypothetical protein
MYLKYGNYSHANNEVGYTITSQALKSQGGYYYANKVHWACHGALLGTLNNLTTQAQITAAIQDLVNAYSNDGYDLVHYLDDGVTPTAHSLISSNCIGGTRVVQPPSFPMQGGEYQVGYGRTYEFAIEGEVAITDQNVTISYSESLKFVGTGGPITVFIPVAQGPWVQQQTSQRSTYRVVQSGKAVGLYGTPILPAPIWPAAELVQLRDVSIESPQRYGAFNWPLSWSYTFESNGILLGTPTLPTL